MDSASKNVTLEMITLQQQTINCSLCVQHRPNAALILGREDVWVEAEGGFPGCSSRSRAISEVRRPIELEGNTSSSNRSVSSTAGSPMSLDCPAPSADKPRTAELKDLL